MDTLSKWHNGNYFHPPISLDCSDAVKALSGSPLNVHNLLLAIYRSEVPDVLARIDPKLMLELRKTLVQIRSFLDIGVSVCDKDQTGLTIADVCRLIEGIPQACDEADFEIKHDLNYKRTNVKIEQNITKKQHTRAKRLVNLVLNSVFKSGNDKLPDVVLKLEVPIQCYSAQTNVRILPFQSGNIDYSEIQEEDPGSQFFDSVFIAIILTGVSDLESDLHGLPSNEDLNNLNKHPRRTISLTRGETDGVHWLTMSDFSAAWDVATHTNNGGVTALFPACDTDESLHLSDAAFITKSEYDSKNTTTDSSVSINTN